MPQRKSLERILPGLLVSVLIAGVGASCALNSRASLRAPQVETKPKETPVRFQASAKNKGKRCSPMVYSDVGKDVDYNPLCYKLQHRLVEATHKGNLEDMRAALRDGASADGSVYNFYFSPLFTAAYAGRTVAARLLLDNGSDVNQGDFINGTPLIVAARIGDTAIVKLLLERGVDVCFRADGGTAAEFAQEQGHQEIVDLLKAETAKCK